MPSFSHIIFISTLGFLMKLVFVNKGMVCAFAIALPISKRPPPKMLEYKYDVIRNMAKSPMIGRKMLRPKSEKSL